LHRRRSESVGASWLYAQKKIKRFKERNEEARKAFLERVAAISADRLTYIDETGVDEYFHRDRCRAKRGVKIYGSVSGRKYKRTNIVAALCCGVVTEPMEYTGTTDHRVFETWFEKTLLARLPEDRTLIMDNATFHRKKALYKLAHQAKCELLFLPPYSPDLNPIENTWANLKTFLRNYASIYENLQDALLAFFHVE
jgi:transposase